MTQRFQILLTNDDGILSPGLWAAAEALSTLGYVTVAAPREQASGAGRSFPHTSDGRIERKVLHIKEQDWEVFSIGGTPAQVVQHTIVDIMTVKPDLVVSGINYGENLGTGITGSGTVGAALEGASNGIPSIAVSLQLLGTDYLSYHPIDFSASAYFTRLFAEKMLTRPMQPDVEVLKVEVPHDATPATPWKVTSLARHPYYRPLNRRSVSWDEPYYMEGVPGAGPDEVSRDSDVYALLYDKVVSVTPLSLDMTSRVELSSLQKNLEA